MKEYSSKGWNLENSYTSLTEKFYTYSNPTPVKAPELVVFNYDLAESLGLSLSHTSAKDLALLFSGNILPKQATPIAQSYAGHQFGHFTILGDGRAHLLGEQITPDGRRYDIQLKGSGSTPYSRRGDGRAALAPMLREYIISEAMHALGIPTTRSLAVVATGEIVVRATELPGAILTRVASSHLRVGTFEYANTDDIKALTDYTIARHYPELLTNTETPYLAFLKAVIERQAQLVARWMNVGFIHGVMNTDNMTISGETIDYGPCAFMDSFSFDTVFSSIDINGRYSFGNQAGIAQWNLARFAETLLPLLHADENEAIEIAKATIDNFPAIFQKFWLAGMRQKLGLLTEEASDLTLIKELLNWMQETGADYTTTFRELSPLQMPSNEAYQSPKFKTWYTSWQTRLQDNNSNSLEVSLQLMRECNPVIIPRNQHVEVALSKAEEGNLKPFLLFLEALQNPFDETESNVPYRVAPPHNKQRYQTFCGT
jgi:serine/tyrosine/threonine adenylyltransferase